MGFPDYCVRLIVIFFLSWRVRVSYRNWDLWVEMDK